MSTLQGFPFVNQRTDSNINAEFDCVPASLTAAANYLLGKNAINDSIMKNEIYGVNYVGGTAASSFVNYLKQRGLHLYSASSTYKELLARAHKELAAGHPVIFTRDDPYSSNPDMTHVCVWFKDEGASLTCMDPYGARAITMTDGQWLSHLRAAEIWIMEKAMIDVLDVSGFFTAESETAWKCKNGLLLIGGMLNFFRHMPNPLAVIGLPRTGELDVPGHPGVKIQVFERIVLCYDPNHTLDSPPDAGDVYAMHLDSISSLAVQQQLKLLGIQAGPPAPNNAEVKNNLNEIERLAQLALGHL